MTLPLEKQVCNRELSKRLYELGVRQKSLFWWLELNTGFRVTRRHHTWRTCYSAFTVAELGEMLPQQCKYGKDEPWLVCTKNLAGRWEVGYARTDKGFTEGYAAADTEANCRARMLIYLLENNLITIN